VLPKGVEHWVSIDRIGILLFDATLSTTIFLSLVLLAMLGCRQPARRILIARLAFLASLAMIPLVAIEPLPRLDLVDLFVESELLPAPRFVSSDPIELATATADESPGTPNRARRRPVWQPDSAAGTGRVIRRGITLLDLACMGAGIAWLLLGFGGVHWLIQCADEPSLTSRGIFDELVAGGSPLAARSILRVSSRIRRPVVVGLLRPTILIPTSLDRSGRDTESLRLSLLHEIAHIERSDHWFGTLASLAQTVWFFLPQVWWLRSRLLIDQEFLADRSAAERYGTSFSYASSLLSMAARPEPLTDVRTGDSPPDWPSTGKMDIQSPLSQRVLMLLHCPFSVEARIPRFWSWTSKLTVIGASLMAACLFVRWPNVVAIEQQPGLTAAASSRRFRVLHFIAEPQVFSPGGRSLPYLMPLALPPEFDLTVEVHSSPVELPQIHIAGLPLGDPRLFPIDDLNHPLTRSVPSRSWRQVHLRRDRNGISLEIDGRRMSVESGSNPLSDWLTFEPGPLAPAEFRGLVVSW
jgi:hypothetical protein